MELEVENADAEMIIALETDSQSIDAVSVVTRINRESEFAAIAGQRNSIVATQVVGAQELSRKGVSDAQGAVMKVSGISIRRVQCGCSRRLTPSRRSCWLAG